MSLNASSLCKSHLKIDKGQEIRWPVFRFRSDHILLSFSGVTDASSVRFGYAGVYYSTYDM